MCGIAGIIGTNGRVLGEKMVSKLAHRGPDGNGIWVSPESDFPAIFCHTRLSILDLSKAADQPFESFDKRYILTYNGEIYNFLELKKDLQANGCQFKTDSDTEVLLMGLIHEGLSFLHKCNGMWAFCLWDRFEKKAIFCRDRFGVKPLYFTFLDDGSFAFSSEMKGLTPFLSSVEPSPWIDACYSNQFNYESTSKCAINKISRFMPSYSYTFCDNKLHSEKWWNPLDHISPTGLNYHDQVSHWKELFLDAVSIRMRSDVPIGTALSGGLDSSCVMATMAYVAKSSQTNLRISSSWQNGFCSSFPGSSLDEVAWATKVADSLSCNFKSVYIDPVNSGWSLEDSLVAVEDPYLTIPIPMLATYKAIKNHGISVTLDGHGADELFSGYGHIYNAFMCAKTRSQFKEIVSIDESSRSGVLSSSARLKKRVYLKLIFKHFLLKNKLLPRQFLGALASNGSSEYSEELIRIRSHPNYLSMDFFTQQLYEIYVLSILPTLLRNYDRYSMASGVEVRMPFMDWRLMCFTFSLPWTSKLGGSFTKRIQRDAMQGILINEVRTRRDKIGWNAPAHEWFQGPLRSYVHDLIAKSSNSKYFASANKSWANFQYLSSPSFSDGQKLWNSILPIAYNNCLSNDLWR